MSPNDYEENHLKHQVFFPSCAFLKNDALPAELQGVVGHTTAEEAQPGQGESNAQGEGSGPVKEVQALGQAGTFRVVQVLLSLVLGLMTGWSSLHLPPDRHRRRAQLIV